ncbi:MAG: response regulator transcription factor [Myxococcota bacterium]
MSAESNPQTILLVEDDPALALGLVDTLEFEGFNVVHTRSGKDAVTLMSESPTDCVILDLMLPDINGYQVCEQLRAKHRSVPILMLTARSQEADKIRGLDVGADDYVTKPFSLGELVARIRALFRRATRSAPDPTEPFMVGAAQVNPASHTLAREGAVISLSFYEVEILKLLHEKQGQPVSRDDILDQVWGVEGNASNRTVDNFIVKIRKKIEPQPEKPRFIVTLYGVGYKMTAPNA